MGQGKDIAAEDCSSPGRCARFRRRTAGILLGRRL